MAPTVSPGLNEVAWPYQGFDDSAHHVSIPDYITRRDENRGKFDDGNDENNVDDAATYHFVSNEDLDNDLYYPVVTHTNAGDALSDTEVTSPQTTTTSSPTAMLPLYTIVLGWLLLALDFFVAFAMAIMREPSNGPGFRRWLQFPCRVFFHMVHEPLVGFAYIVMGLAALIWMFVRNLPCGSGVRSYKAAVDGLFSRDTPWCPYLRFKAATFDYAHGGTARSIRAMLEPMPAPTTEAPPSTVPA